MKDTQTTIEQLKARMAEFVAQREWQKYHLPKNLAMSLAIETAELMEHFQWVTHEEAEELLKDPAARQEVADEMADVLAFLLSLANCLQLDLSAEFERKMLKNEQKYPPEKVKGNYKRPKP